MQLRHSFAANLSLATVLVTTSIAHSQSESPATATPESANSSPTAAAAPDDSASSTSASADGSAPAAPDAPPGDLWISFTPYLWAASVDATVANRGISTSFDVGFDDIIKDLDFALMLHLEVGYRRAFFFGDYEYLRLSRTVDIYEPLLTSADVPKLLSSIDARDPTFGDGPFAASFTNALVQADGDLDRAKELLVQQVDSSIAGAQARIAAVNEQLATIGSNIRQALASLTPEQRRILAQLAQNRLDPRVQEALRRISAALQNATTRDEASLRALVGDAYDAAKLRFAEKDQQIQAAIIAALAALTPGPELDYVEATMELQIAEFGGGYRLIDWDLGRPIGEQQIVAGLDRPFVAPSARRGPSLEFDVLVGARYFNLAYGQTLAFTPDKFGILPAVVESDDRYEWVDAIVGGRIGLSLSREWRIWCRGDAGGFQRSNNSWCVQGGVIWAPLSWLQVVAGYRALGIQYQENGTSGFEFDGVLQGPFLGASLTF